MTTSRFISLIILAMMTSMVWWLEDIVSTAQQEELRKKSNRPDFYMENFTLHQYDEAGDLDYQTQGTSLIRYPVNDSLEIEGLDMQAYKAGKMPFTINANKARIDEDGDQIFLSGNVKMLQQEGPDNDLLSIESEKLFIDNNRDYLETNKQITIKTSKHEISGVGMQAWVELDKFRLMSKVRGTHEP